MEYSNPLNELANPSDFAGSPFLQAQQAYLKNDLAMPLIQAQQKMALASGLQNAQKIAEFMSPEQKGLRQAEISDKMAGFQHNVAKRPLELQGMGLDNQGKQADLDKRALELRQALRAEEAAPARAMYQALGQRSNEIAQMPEAARALAWTQMVEEIQAQHPGLQIPDKLRSYSPNALTNGLIAFRASQNDPRNLFTAGENEKNRQAELERARIAAQGTRDAASINARARSEDSRRSPDQMIVDIGRELRDPKLDPSRRADLEAQYRALRRQKILGSKVVADFVSNAQVFPNRATGRPYTPEEIQQGVMNIIQMQESQDTLLADRPTPTPTPSPTPGQPSPRPGFNPTNGIPARNPQDIFNQYGIK